LDVCPRFAICVDADRQNRPKGDPAAVRYNTSMAIIQRILRAAAVAVFFVLLYVVVIAATPLALIVLVIQILIHALGLVDSDKQASLFGLGWFFLVAVSGMVINLLCIPAAMLWFWIKGKPMPHPLG
jgi:hypothetical protein